ncbi:MAG: DUF2924 domain-containing protein [Candidatus Binataceae bacterium]|jgi:hypothetical protein
MSVGWNCLEPRGRNGFTACSWSAFLAYRLQEKALGGLKPATRRLLRQIAEGSAQGRSPKNQVKPQLKAGTYRVTVLEQAFQYGRERFRSLSEVARRITGTH